MRTIFYIEHTIGTSVFDLTQDDINEDDRMLPQRTINGPNRLFRSCKKCTAATPEVRVLVCGPCNMSGK